MSQVNWAGNLTYQVEPQAVSNVSTIQAHVRDASRIKVIGSRHSFNDIADSSVSLLSMQGLDQVLDIDTASSTVTFEGGVRYGELAVHLHDAGYALHNLASLPHISVSGACATGTHGSGVGNGNLATQITALSFVDGTGELVQVSRADDPDLFDGVVVNLGALGIITQMTATIEPTFDIQQSVYLDLSLDQYTAHFDEIMALGYSVSAFTDWRGSTIDQVWIKRKASDPQITSLYDAQLATRTYHPIRHLPADGCTIQLGEWGAWHERLPHFQMAFTPSSGAELQTEYFVDYRDAGAAIRALQAIGDVIAPKILVSEIRRIAPDTLWLSPCYERDSVAFHFTWERDWPSVRPILQSIEAALAPFAPRAHWGKLFTLAPEAIRTAYPRFDDFRALAEQYDPQGKFRNRYLDALL